MCSSLLSQENAENFMEKKFAVCIFQESIIDEMFALECEVHFTSSKFRKNNITPIISAGFNRLINITE